MLKSWLSSLLGAETARQPAPAPTRRSVERLSTYEVAWLKPETGDARRGVVLDFSERGVRMRFMAPVAVPDQVRINIPELSLDRPAEVIWRSREDIGLKFLDASAA
ncbi:MAG: PilZ domain-containing protein [Pseudomonadota bacterium]